MLTLTSTPAGSTTTETVRLWLLGAETLTTAYSPLADTYTLVSGVRGVRAGGSGAVTVSVTGTWSPEYPRAAGGSAVAAAFYPHEDMDQLHDWLSEGTRLVNVSARRADNSDVAIGVGVLAGGGINPRTPVYGETTVIDWSIAINMAAGMNPIWQGNRPARPAGEPDPGGGGSPLAWQDTPTTFPYRSGGSLSVVLPGAMGGAPPYVYSGVPPTNWGLDVATRTVTKLARIITVGDQSMNWRVTDADGMSLTLTIAFTQSDAGG